MEDTALVFENVPKLCTSKNIKTSVTIKPCFVLLEDIDHKIKAMHECCLIQPNVKKLLQKTQNKTTDIKDLKVVLSDIMKKGNIRNPKKPLQMRNAEAVLDDAKEKQKENTSKPNSSANLLCSEADSGQTNEDYDDKKTESEADTSNFCDMGIFAKLSKYVNSFLDPGHVQESVKGKGSLQVDSVLIPETQNTDKSPKVSLRRKGAFALPDEADLCKAACESEPCFASLRTGDNPGLDIKDTVPWKTHITMPVKPCSVNLTEEGIKKQMDETKVERQTQSNPAFKNLKDEDCWFLMEIDEVVEVEDPVCVTDEDSLSRERDCDDVSFSPDVGRPQTEIESGCESHPDDAANIKHKIKTRTMGSQGKHAGRSANSRTEGKTYPGGAVQPKPSSLGESRSKRRRNLEEAPANHLLLTESQSRTKVVDALRKTLQKRLDDSPDLNVKESAVLKVAKRVERALFKLFCCVDQHYKNKYRSLLFNLKSPDNELLFRRVLLGDITPERLVQMTFLEMAPKQLAEWRASENKRVLEVIEREEQEAPRFCPTKFTHKGIVEIHREVDEDLAPQETLESIPLDSSCEAPTGSGKNPSVKDFHRTGGSAFSTSTEQMAGKNVTVFKPRHLEWREKMSKRCNSNLPDDSIPEKLPETEKQSRRTVIWQGLIQMFSLKQFAAKAYPVSGSTCVLSEVLPLLLHSKGCILPEDVWVYLDSLRPANSKAVAIIQFCPCLTRDNNPYNMLYSYLSNKQRYGIVGTSRVEMFMVPLAAFQPLPSKLQPLGGPGLDLRHPSLLLGLILPKRTRSSILVTKPSPLPKTKKKRVTFKDSTENKCSDPPSHLPMDTSLTHPPSHQLPMPGLLCENEGPPEPLAVSHLSTLPEAPAGVMCSSGHCEYPADSTNPSPLVNLQSVSGSSWIEGQTWGSLGAQPYQTMNQGQFGMDLDPTCPWNSLGFNSSEFLYPNQHGVDEANNLEALFLPNQLCTEAAPPYEVSPESWMHQIPCTTSVAEAPSSIIEETWALIQRVTQLQPNLQSQPLLSDPVGFPSTPQEVSSAMSQVAAEFPPDQQDNGMFAQLQLLLSTLGGPAQPPSAI